MIKVGRRRSWPARRDLGVTILLGCVLAAHLLIQAHGLQHTSAINTGWIVAFIPVCLAVGAHSCLKQRVKSIGWLGVLIGAGGVFLVTVSSPPDFANARFGDVLQLCSCLTWTVFTLAAVGVVARNDSLSVTTSAMAIAAILVTVAALWTGFVNGALTGRVVLAVVFLGLVCSGLPYYLWFQALDEHGAARIGSVLYFEPFVTMAFAASLLNEPITGNATAGGVCVLIGVWLVASGTPRRSQHKGVDRIGQGRSATP
jgi:drug/metabolite transporter (DMT)-like permease